MITLFQSLTKRLLTLIFLTVFIFNVTATDLFAQSGQETPANTTIAEFQSLRWIEGTWRGTGDDTDPFYESYRFINESTIRFWVYKDSSLTQLNYGRWIVLSEGEVTYQSGRSVWVATELDSNSVHFDPKTYATNSFTFIKTSPSSWKAILRSQQGKQVYHLEHYSGK